jgi:hypothetical protein
MIDDLLLERFGIDYWIYGPPQIINRFIDCVLEYLDVSI